MNATRTAILLLALLVFGGARAQLPDYHLQLFNYSIGIRPGNYVAMAKDSRGFLWILYPRSIQRFDGRNMEEFPLGGNFQYLHADRMGGVWVASARSVLRYADDSRGFTRVGIGMRDSTHALGPVFSLSDGRVYLFSAEGLHPMDSSGARFGPAETVQRDHALNQTDLFASYDMTIFFRAGGSIYACDRRDMTLRKLPNRNNYRIHPLNQRTLLSSTWENDSWQYDFAQGSVRPLRLPDAYGKTSGKTFSIRSLVETAPGIYLLAAREGIFSYDARNKLFHKLQFFQDGYPVVTNDYCQQFFVDTERNAWMLTTAGIARFPLDRQSLGLLRVPQPANQPQGSVNNVREMAEDGEGNIWMATGNGFLQWKKKNGSWHIHTAEAGSRTRLSHPSIRGIAWDGRWVILGPTNFGVWLFEPSSGRYRRPVYAADSVKRIMERDFVDNIHTLRNGNHLVMGRDAVYLLEDRSYRLSILDIPASRANSNRAFERPDGLVWVVTQKGLYLLDAQLRHLDSAVPEGTDPAIWTGCQRKDGSILFPTVQGLYEGSWDGRSIRIRKVTDAIDKVFLNSIYEDRKGRIWASSEKGILCFNPANRQMTVFDYADNIQGYGFNGNGPMLHSSGLLFWGGTNGINYLDPEQYAFQTDPLRVYIHNVRHGSHDSLLNNLAQTAELPYASPSLEVEWKAPYYSNPEKIKYRYRIRGLDETWKFPGNNNRLRVTSIPPGQYQLQVQASVDALHWVDAQQALSFIVTEPFWRRGWFLALCALIVGIAWWLIADFRNRKRARKREAENLLAETRQKIADAEMQALRAQMNPHFIFNCLNSINRYIVKSDQATASRYLTRFAKLIRLILDNSNSRTVSLSNELEALKLYIEMESIRFEKQFTWEINVDPDVQQDTIHVPPLIIQPYVENAIWHGLLHKETAGHLRVHVCQGNDRLLEVIIEDNGVGREAAGRLRSKTASGNKSLGMKLTEERLRLLDRNMALSATVEVEDLRDKNGTALGTRVLLKIPLDRE